MIVVDWTEFLFGGTIGLVMGALFFIGLAVGVRYALRSENSIMLLSLSAVIRIAALLGVGWIVLALGGSWAGAGYAVAFLLARFIATTFARVGVPARGAS
nr:ATP synthase subunit AtpR [uncultured Roseovarius sp.]